MFTGGLRIDVYGRFSYVIILFRDVVLKEEVKRGF